MNKIGKYDMVFAKPKVLIPLRRRDKRWKVFNERKERYHSFKVQSAFSEYYETNQIGIPPYIEEDSISESEKRRLKRNAKHKDALILRALIQDERNNREQN